MTGPDPKPDTHPDALAGQPGTSTHRPDGRVDTQVAPPAGAGGPALRRVGPYLLIRSLGTGAFGEVWLAELADAVAAAPRAVKIPHVAHADPAAVRREAAVWASAGTHPNVLPLLEAAVYDGQVVIASEYAADGSLAAWLDTFGKEPVPLDRAVEVACGVLAGLEHLHARGIVHRDIKPANILLQGGVPRLADFGLARGLGAEVSAHVPAGTPAYMAPEAFAGDRTVQTDLWAVGVLLYRLLAGRVPFPAADWVSAMDAIRNREPDPLPPTVPAEVQAVVAWALVKDPAKRVATAAEMRASLRGVPSVAPPPRPAAAPLVVSSVAMFLLPVPAGEFLMGSADDDPCGYLEERPQHRVVISKSFWLGATPVTQNQFSEVMGYNPSRFKEGRRPVELVTWFQAVEFCDRLSVREGLPPYYELAGPGEIVRKGGPGFRLPTEAEWEYACRAGTTGTWWFPRDELDRFVWYRDNAEKRTHSVGRKAANPWGFRDLLGNVWEWCWDRYLETYYLESPERDPPGPNRGRDRVLRGGSFGDGAGVQRCANRFCLPTTGKLDNAGFRVARDAG